MLTPNGEQLANEYAYDYASLGKISSESKVIHLSTVKHNKFNSQWSFDVICIDPLQNKFLPIAVKINGTDFAKHVKPQLWLRGRFSLSRLYSWFLDHDFSSLEETVPWDDVEKYINDVYSLNHYNSLSGWDKWYADNEKSINDFGMSLVMAASVPAIAYWACAALPLYGTAALLGGSLHACEKVGELFD